MPTILTAEIQIISRISKFYFRKAAAFTCHTSFFQFKLYMVHLRKLMQGRYRVYYSLFVSSNEIN